MPLAPLTALTITISTVIAQSMRVLWGERFRSGAKGRDQGRIGGRVRFRRARARARASSPPRTPMTPTSLRTGALVPMGWLPMVIYRSPSLALPLPPTMNTTAPASTRSPSSTSSSTSHSVTHDRMRLELKQSSGTGTGNHINSTSSSILFYVFVALFSVFLLFFIFSNRFCELYRPLSDTKR
jgi:hypothetical protein